MYISDTFLINGMKYSGIEISELVYDLISLSLKVKVIYIEKSKFGTKVKQHIKWFDFPPEHDVNVNEILDKIIEYHEQFRI